MEKNDLLTKQDLRIMLKKAFQEVREIKYDSKGFVIPPTKDVALEVLKLLIEYTGEEYELI